MSRVLAGLDRGSSIRPSTGGESRRVDDGLVAPRARLPPDGGEPDGRGHAVPRPRGGRQRAGRAARRGRALGRRRPAAALRRPVADRRPRHPARRRDRGGRGRPCAGCAARRPRRPQGGCAGRARAGRRSRRRRWLDPPRVVGRRRTSRTRDSRWPRRPRSNERAPGRRDLRSGRPAVPLAGHDGRARRRWDRHRLDDARGGRGRPAGGRRPGGRRRPGRGGRGPGGRRRRSPTRSWRSRSRRGSAPSEPGICASTRSTTPRCGGCSPRAERAGREGPAGRRPGPSVHRDDAHDLRVRPVRDGHRPGRSRGRAPVPEVSIA